ncbi:hypothetical protein KCU83_g110, partial [Aureobasidium melanogenum]
MHVLLNQAPIRYPGPGSILMAGFHNQSIVSRKTDMTHRETLCGTRVNIQLIDASWQQANSRCSLIPPRPCLTPALRLVHEQQISSSG